MIHGASIVLVQLYTQNPWEKVVIFYYLSKLYIGFKRATCIRTVYVKVWPRHYHDDGCYDSELLGWNTSLVEGQEGEWPWYKPIDRDFKDIDTFRFLVEYSQKSLGTTEDNTGFHPSVIMVMRFCSRLVFSLWT